MDWRYDKMREGADQRLSDLGFIPDKYCLACSVISMLGRVFPQAIMFHLTSTCSNNKVRHVWTRGGCSWTRDVCSWSEHVTLDAGDVESPSVVAAEGSSGLVWPASSGRVS